MDPEPLPLVIVNPASRGGAGAHDWPRAASALRTHFGAFQCAFTERKGHATSLAREGAAAGRRLVLTFGGDGTISETARGLLDAGASCALGILPHGTGGDFRRSLSIPERIADAARELRHGRTIAIDVGRVRFADGTERSFVNSASFGLSAAVAERVNRSEDPSTFNYVKETAQAAFDYEPLTVFLSADERESTRREVTLVSLHNGRYFGGGMKMAPEASLTDGKLQVVIVDKMSPVRLLRQAPRLYFGGHTGLREVEHGSVERLTAEPVDRETAVLVEVDGETPGRLPARFDVRPKSLHVRVGRDRGIVKR